MPSPVSSTPRKRPHCAGQRQITTFFSPSSSSSSSSSSDIAAAAAPKLAPDLPPDLQSSLLTVGMRVRRSMAQSRDRPVFVQSQLSPANPMATPTPGNGAGSGKRSRDEEAGEGDTLGDTQTAEQREQARVAAAAVGARKKASASGMTAGRMGGYWKSVKRRPEQQAKGVGIGKGREGEEEDFGEAGFLMEVDS